MDILDYLGRNESGGIDSAGILELESVLWERTHYSPFGDLYALHVQIEKQKNCTGSGCHFAYTHTAHDYVKFYVECVAIVIIGIPGIVGNILSACVLLSAKMRSPITCLLLGLALTDLLMILNGLLGMAATSFCLYFKIDLLQHRFVAFLPVIFVIGRTAHVASVLYALCITLERYFAVKNPLKARMFCTLRRAKWTSAIVLIFSIVYNIPRWFEYTYITVSVPKTDDYGNVLEGEEDYYYLPVTGDLRRNEIYVRFVSVIHFSFFYVIPMVVIIYFNVLICIKVKFAQEQRATMTVSQMTENNVTTMLLLIVVVFIMCNCLPVVNLVARILTGSPQVFVLDSIRNFLWIFNSSINFLIYYAYSDGFRETCVELWPAFFKNVCCAESRTKGPRKYNSNNNLTHSTSSSRLSVATVASTLGSMKQRSNLSEIKEVEIGNQYLNEGKNNSTVTPIVAS